MPESLADNRSPAEFAHVLFLDMVGYSLLSMEEQERCAHELRALVQATSPFTRNPAAADLLTLGTGDGMALLFFRDPLGPVQCAVEIARALHAQPRVRVRMGIHSGPVTRMIDIAGHANAAGSGLNTAFRVMDCGDSGHILLSATVAETVRDFEAWSDSLVDLGEAEVKHGIRLHLFSLVHGDIGNPARPSRMGIGAPPETAAAPTEMGAATGRRVVLLYKRRAAHEERLLAVLEKALTTAGYSVFVDRHLQIGVAWAEEIARQITGADAVIALLSEHSIRSEMLEYESLRAQQAFQEQGKPRLLPVRVAYEGPLPESLEAIYGALQYSLWTTSDDDDRLIGDILTALQGQKRPERTVARRERAGGAVPLDSQLYVIRPTDAEFEEAIDRRDSIVLVKGARQMGKTSLLARGLQKARQSGDAVVLTDFQALSSVHLASADTLYLALAQILADQLDLDTLPEEVWNPNRGANMNLERYLRRGVFDALGDAPLVWGLDEVDKLFACDFGSEVFGLFRSWHNRRSLDPTGPWSRLTLAIAYATEAHLFITDLNQSPFNVGTRLTLADFAPDQVADLNERYGSPLKPAAVQQFAALVGGQPYLTRRGLDEFAAGLTLERFLAEASHDEGIYGDHLRRILLTLSQEPAMLEVVRGLLHGLPCPTPESFYRLRTAGLIQGGSADDATLRCPLYQSYLERHLLR